VEEPSSVLKTMKKYGKLVVGNKESLTESPICVIALHYIRHS